MPLVAAFSWRDAGSMHSDEEEDDDDDVDVMLQQLRLQTEATSSNDEIASIRGHVFGRNDRL